MKPKSLAIMLLGKKKPEDDEDGGDDPKMPPLEDVMQELIDAVKADDAKAAAKAFRGAMACSQDEEADDEADESETDDEA